MVVRLICGDNIDTTLLGLDVLNVAWQPEVVCRGTLITTLTFKHCCVSLAQVHSYRTHTHTHTKVTFTNVFAASFFHVFCRFTAVVSDGPGVVVKLYNLLAKLGVAPLRI